MIKAKSIKYNLIWNTIRIFASYIFPIITFAYISRILGVSGFGKVNYVYSIASYFSMVALLGIPTYILREGAKVRDNNYKLGKLVSEIYIILFFSTAVSIIGYAFLLYLDDFANYTDLLIIMSLIIPFSSIGASWYFQIIEDYQRISLQAILFQAVSTLLIFLFVKTNEDIVKYGILCILGSISSNIVYFIDINKRLKLFGFRDYNIKQHFKPIIIIFGMTIASSVYVTFDSIMLGYMVGVEAVGFYSVAIKLVNVVITLIASMNGVILARLSVYVNKGDTTKFNELIFDAFDFIMMIAIPACIGLFVLSEQIIIIFSGIQYLQSVFTLKLLCINLILSPLNGLIAYQVFMPFGKERYSLIATIVGCIVNITLNLYFIPLYHQNGAAVTTIIAELSVFSICILFAKQFVKIKLVFKQVYQYVMASIPIICIGYYVPYIINHMVYEVIAVVLLGSIMYFLILILLKNAFLIKVINSIYYPR